MLRLIIYVGSILSVVAVLQTGREDNPCGKLPVRIQLADDGSETNNLEKSLRTFMSKPWYPFKMSKNCWQKSEEEMKCSQLMYHKMDDLKFDNSNCLNRPLYCGLAYIGKFHNFDYILQQTARYSATMDMIMNSDTFGLLCVKQTARNKGEFILKRCYEGWKTSYENEEWNHNIVHWKFRKDDNAALLTAATAERATDAEDYAIVMGSRMYEKGDNDKCRYPDNDNEDLAERLTGVMFLARTEETDEAMIKAAMAKAASLDMDTSKLFDVIRMIKDDTCEKWRMEKFNGRNSHQH